jgi:hypothetical protein
MVAKSLKEAIDELFREPPIARDLALQLLNSWIANLQATEALINRELLALTSVFVSFLALDTGILGKLTFQGAELQRTGLVLAVAPLTMAYLYYRVASQISFVHDIRTAIALLYKHLHEPVYSVALDLFTHIPSVRNLEAYDSLRSPFTKKFYERTTDAVTIILTLGPLVALVYTLYRLWSYADLGIAPWTIITVVSLLFVIRAALFGPRFEEDTFSQRRTTSQPSDAPPRDTAGPV